MFDGRRRCFCSPPSAPGRPSWPTGSSTATRRTRSVADPRRCALARRGADVRAGNHRRRPRRPARDRPANIRARPPARADAGNRALALRAGRATLPLDPVRSLTLMSAGAPGTSRGVTARPPACCQSGSGRPGWSRTCSSPSPPTTSARTTTGNSQCSGRRSSSPSPRCTARSSSCFRGRSRSTRPRAAHRPHDPGSGNDPRGAGDRAGRGCTGAKGPDHRRSALRQRNPLLGLLRRDSAMRPATSAAAFSQVAAVLALRRPDALRVGFQDSVRARGRTRDRRRPDAVALGIVAAPLRSLSVVPFAVLHPVRRDAGAASEGEGSAMTLRRRSGLQAPCCR